jgi:type 1 glutamine amidotransferase
VSVPPLQRKLDRTFVATITGQQCKDIKRWVQEGGSLRAWHISLMRQDYRDVQGATIIGHPPVRPFQVKTINHDQPITAGVNDFMVTVEQYRSRGEKRSNTCETVWAYDYGKGRVCFMAPGHAMTALWNPEFEKMQKNAVEWLPHQTWCGR